VDKQLYHHANFHADRREILSVPGQNKYIFSLLLLLLLLLFIIGTPLGATVPCYTLFYSSRRANPIWHVTLRLTFFEIFAVKIWDFGASWRYPQRAKDLGDPYLPSRKMPDRSVAPSPRYSNRTHTYKERILADLISCRQSAYISVAYVDNKLSYPRFYSFRLFVRHDVNLPCMTTEWSVQIREWHGDGESGNSAVTSVNGKIFTVIPWGW